MRKIRDDASAIESPNDTSSEFCEAAMPSKRNGCRSPDAGVNEVHKRQIANSEIGEPIYVFLIASEYVPAFNCIHQRKCAFTRGLADLGCRAHDSNWNRRSLCLSRTLFNNLLHLIEGVAPWERKHIDD
jgi:hypothetical protein